MFIKESRRKGRTRWGWSKEGARYNAIPFWANSAWLTGLKSYFLAFATPPFFAAPFAWPFIGTVVPVILVENCEGVVKLEVVLRVE